MLFLLPETILAPFFISYLTVKLARLNCPWDTSSLVLLLAPNHYQYIDLPSTISRIILNTAGHIVQRNTRMIFPTHIARVYIGRTAAIIPEFLVIFKLSFSARIVKYERSYWWMHWPRLHRKDHCVAGVFGKPVKVFSFYQTRVRSLAALVTNSLTN